MPGIISAGFNAAGAFDVEEFSANWTFYEANYFNGGSGLAFTAGVNGALVRALTSVSTDSSRSGPKVYLRDISNNNKLELNGRSLFESGPVTETGGSQGRNDRVFKECVVNNGVLLIPAGWNVFVDAVALANNGTVSFAYKDL